MCCPFDPARLLCRGFGYRAAGTEQACKGISVLWQLDAGFQRSTCNRRNAFAFSICRQVNPCWIIGNSERAPCLRLCYHAVSHCSQAEQVILGSDFSHHMDSQRLCLCFAGLKWRGRQSAVIL